MHPRFERFIDRMSALTARPGVDEPELLAQARPMLAELVSHDDWLAPGHALPHPAYYQQYLLHLCPAGRYSVVSFVWGPGQQTPVHDHTVWGLIGMLRGSEVSTAFVPAENGPGLVAGESTVLRPGMVEAVSPRIGDVHQVRNAHDDRVSISIHVYGADIGKVRRHVFDPATGQAKSFVSGYANAVTS